MNESINIQRSTDEAHPMDPIEYIRVLNATLAKDPTPSGHDGLPIRWMVAVRPWGLIVTDSALITDGFIFRQGADNHNLGLLLQAVLDWLADQIPGTQYWAVSFRPGTTPIPTTREVIP